MRVGLVFKFKAYIPRVQTNFLFHYSSLVQQPAAGELPYQNRLDGGTLSHVFELVVVMFLVRFVLCTGSGLLGTSIALNALSEHGACTVWFSLVSMILIIVFSSIRTWDRMTWPMTLGFASVLGDVLAVVVGVALRNRPAAAPAEGEYELGFYVAGAPTFAAGITATATIFVASSAGPVYLPMMKRPQDYRKAVIPVGFLVASIYLSVALVVCYYCGQWVATPSLGSAGPLIKKVGP